MSSDPSIRFTQKDRQMCEIIVAQQELNATVQENPEQDPLQEID